MASAARGTALDEFRVLWAWSTTGDHIGSAAFEIVDLDGDGRIELLTSASVDPSYPFLYDGRWYVVELGASPVRQTWSSFAYEDQLRVVRLSPGARRQIVAATRSSAFVYDAVTKEPLREYSLETTDTAGLGIDDIDADGDLDLAACDETGLFVQDFQTGAVLASNYSFDCSTLEIGQLDGDPALEIAVTGGTFGTLVIDGANFAVQWADVQSSGSLLLVSNTLSDENDELLYQLVEGGEVRAVDVDQNLTTWVAGGLYPSSLSRGDADADGDFEIIIIDSNGAANVLDELSGETLLTIDPVPRANGVAAAIADVDLDGDPDLVVPVRGSPDYETVAAFDVASSAPLFVLGRTESPIVDLGAGELEEPPTRFVATASSADGPFSARLLRFDAPEFELGHSAPIEHSNSDGPVGLLAAQLDTDVASELCVAYFDFDGGTVYCEDSETHEEQWRVHFAEAPVSLVAADLDLDGTNEVLVGTTRAAVYALDGQVGWLRWRSPIFWESSLQVLRVGDVDLDPEREVVAGGPGSGPYPDHLVVFDAETGALEWGPHETRVLAFDVGQINPDARDEVIVGTDEGELRILDVVSGAISAPLSDFGQPVHSLRIADFDRDGVPDFAACAAGRLLIHGGAQADLIYASPYLHYLAGFTDSLHVADLDRNGVVELLVGTYVGAAAIEAPLILVFADGVESGDTSAWTMVLP